MLTYWRVRRDLDPRNVREHIHADYKSDALNHSAPKTQPRTRVLLLSTGPLAVCPMRASKKLIEFGEETQKATSFATALTVL